MGVNIVCYTVFGLKLPWNDDFNDAYEEVYYDKDTPFVLQDGMSGEYMVVGEVLARSEDFRYCDGKGYMECETELTALPQFEKNYKEQFRKKFPEFSHLMDAPFKIIGFTHFS